MQEQPEHCEFVFVDHSKESGYELNEKWGAVPIKFIGREKQSDIVNLYRKIDVLFAPSIWPESFGLVTREAEACGCWVVASNLGGIGEDVIEGQNGHVIDPNESALSAVLSKIDMQPGKYKALSKRNNPNPVSQQVKEIVEFYK
jgi:glycosyltransferase involved in cell wall biosynthesis